MRLTTTFLIYLILNFYNLSAQNKTENNVKKIIGEWTISKTISTNLVNADKTETVCNMCPTVTFTHDQNVTIKNSTKTAETYIWKISNDKITFANIGAEKVENEIFYTDFDLKFTEEKDFVELQLSDASKGFTYILRK
jgi:hypothetical protein